MKTTYLYKLTACAYFSNNKAVSQQTRMTVEREREREREREDGGGSIKRRELHKIRGRSYGIHVLSSKYFAHPYRFIRSMQVPGLPVKDVPP